MIIFITAYAEYAVQSYDWNTVGYLLKPIEFPKFLRAVNKAASQINSKSRDTRPEDSGDKNAGFLLIKSGPQTHQLKVSDILYLEASGNHVVLVTRERKITTLNSLQEVAKLLPPHLFYQVHKSFIVSLPHIEIIESFQVKVNGVAIPLGKSFRGAFLERYKK